ncbi:MAG: glycerophosphodiester phosphodiesterase [Deltaproteobacteria bacterium]|nr:glycerophosphodiester phosphodiesterase [Deltaproteobacteria bacterium]
MSPVSPSTKSPSAGSSHSRPLRVAHRGASAEAPENTAVAFDLALKQGAQAIEMDLQLTADERVIVFHDRVLTKLGLPQQAHELTLAEWQALDLGGWFHPRFAGERVLTLEEVLERWGGRCQLLLELKGREPEREARLARQAAQLVTAGGWLESVWFLCFRAAALGETAQAAHGARLAWNLEHPPDALEGKGPLPPELRVSSAFPWAFSLDTSLVTPARVQTARNLGGQVWAWVCNDAPTLDRLLAAGVDAVMSDNPGWLGEELDRREGGQP